MWAQIGHETTLAQKSVSRKGLILSLRKLSSGKWQARYTDPEGFRRSAGTFQTKASAERALREVLGEIDKGTWELTRERFRSAQEGKTLTLAEVAERYRNLGTRGGRGLSPRTLTEYQRYLKTELAEFAHLPIRQITRRKVEDWWIEFGDSRAVTRQRAYTHLKAVMRYAEENGLIPENPCRIRGAGTAIEPKEAIIPTKKEALAILEVAPQELKALYAIALWGGLRKGELFELRRKDLELFQETGTYIVGVNRAVTWLPNDELIVREPKWSSKRRVPLPASITEVIAKHLNTMGTIDPEALLFPAIPGTNTHYTNHAPNRIWEKIRKQTGYRGSFHTLRSFAGTSYAMTGATLREIMDRLGHSNAKTAMRYQKNAGRELELVGKLDLVK